MDIETGKGYILFTNVDIDEELIKKLSETSTHIYRDFKGNIINQIICVRS